MMLPLILLCLAGYKIRATTACSRLEACNSEFRTGLEVAGIQEPESSAPYCAELRAYSQCIKKANKACRGDLSFHSSTAVIDSLMKRYKCAQQNWGPPYKRPSVKPKSNSVCTHQSNSEYVHCGIFGDPHLKTFTKSYQTCGAKGAWPLIDNKYLAIQVTNMPVINSSSATATTKVTIIIRRVPGCAEEKTFEATSDAPLRPFFVDSSYTTGPEGSVQMKASINKTEKVEIYLRYIDTTLVVRRVGEYLGFSCRLPWDIAKIREENALELCQTGCPGTELLDIASSRGHRLSWETALNKCKQNMDLETEVRNNLTDQYLDWCVFDVMTTGKNEFVSTAHLAQEDVLYMDPSSLRNRTFPLDLNGVPQSSSATISSVDVLLIFHLVLTAVFSKAVST
uniref:RGM domain family member B n=2 Tax=Lygus hesperus TaxID=30085 RepID=A0A0A9YYG6_LYGHE